MPGWQVISWVVVLALPVTCRHRALWWSGGVHDPTAGAEWGSLLLLGISSMYLGFFAWYRGLVTGGNRRAAGRCSSSRRS